MEEYRGYIIEVMENNEKEYPYKAIARKQNEEVKHKGFTKQDAIDLVKVSINRTLEKIEMKNKKQYQ